MKACRTLVRKCWSAELGHQFFVWGLTLNCTVMGLDCKALLLTDFSLKHSKTCGLPQLSSEWEWNRFLKPTTPTTTNCRLHQEIDNLSVSENWHLIAKGRLVTSVLKNLSYCLQCCTWSADNEKTSGSRTVRLTPLTSCKSLEGRVDFLFFHFLSKHLWLQLTTWPQL